MPRSNNQIKLASLTSLFSNITFSHHPAVCKARSKIIHLPEPRSLKQKRAGPEELRGQVVSQQQVKKE